MPGGTRFGRGYVRRVVDDELDEVFPHLPAILIDGPKGVGKTETALQRCCSVRRLDNDSDRAVVGADPMVLAQDRPPVLLDEWHRLPSAWDAVRRLVDKDPTGGRFLLTGSPPTLGTHSGAGRIATVRMRPLTLTERGVADPSVSLRALAIGDRPPLTGHSPLVLSDYVEEIVAGGFPAMRALAGRALATQLDGYLERIVDHDLSEAGFTVRRPATVRSWMRGYAAATATAASWETIRDSATSGVANKPAKETAAAYSELLRTLRILDPLEAWLPTRNQFSRLTGAPKHHLADPALAARLLDRSKRHLISGQEVRTVVPLSGQEVRTVVPRDGTLLGRLFESLVALSVRTYAQAIEARTYHLRTEGGRHEIDLIVETTEGVLGIEAKLGSVPDDHDIRHLRWLSRQLGGDLLDAIVITTGSEAFRRHDGIGVVPLGLLGP